MTRFLFHVFICLILLSGFTKMYAKSDHYEVAVRSIAHEILLTSGDSTGRILIDKIDDHEEYRIRFDKSFSFDPGQLHFVADSIMTLAEIPNSYIIEVTSCDSGTIVYSFHAGGPHGDMIPCIGRIQDNACYEIEVTFIPLVVQNDSDNTRSDFTPVIQSEVESGFFSKNITYYILIGFVLGFITVIYMQNRRSKSSKQYLQIGSFRFDQKKMALIRGKEKQELTGKESDLLQILYAHLNSTVDRDVILKEVWKDEGDYIGRTLDVYISKLRKKFEVDPSISIINVRGVGYKLILD